MSSHSAAKGKAKKSAASSARKTAPSAATRKAKLVSDDQFTISQATITSVAQAAEAALSGQSSHTAEDVQDALNGVHASMDINASREEQCAQHLFSSIVTALRPFVGPQGV